MRRRDRKKSESLREAMVGVVKVWRVISNWGKTEDRRLLLVLVCWVVSVWGLQIHNCKPSWKHEICFIKWIIDQFKIDSLVINLSSSIIHGFKID